MENEKLQEQTESMADYEAHFDDANPWNVVARYQEEGTNLHVKVEGIVNGGVIAMVEGLRGFYHQGHLPAAQLPLWRTKHRRQGHHLLVRHERSALCGRF